MHCLATKQTMIQYISSYDVPHVLIDAAHPSIFYSNDDKRWKWRRNDLMALPIKKLQEVCEYLEEFYNVVNTHNQPTLSKGGFSRGG